MLARKIFISSEQKELQDFRDAVHDYVTSELVMKQAEALAVALSAADEYRRVTARSMSDFSFQSGQYRTANYGFRRPHASQIENIEQ